MDRIIHFKRTLPCSVQQAFNCFTLSELLTTWLTTQAKIDPDVGGSYELFWDPTDPDNNSTIGCKITALCRNQLIAFEWKSPILFKDFTNHADPLTHVVVSFVPAEQGTTIHLVHSGWRRSEEWGAAYIWQQNAWHIAFDNLEAMFT